MIKKSVRLGLLIFAILLFKIEAVPTGNYRNISPKTDNLPGAIETVEKFWKASAADQKNEAISLIRPTPAAFYNKNVRCAAEPVIEAKRPEAKTDSTNVSAASAGTGGTAATTSGSFTKWNEFQDLVVDFSSTIKNKNLSFVRAYEYESFQNEVVVTVKFKFQGIEMGYFFLLYRENAEWKIFMISDGYGTYNPNYAKQGC